jgi:hypothetical protein
MTQALYAHMNNKRKMKKNKKKPKFIKKKKTFSPQEGSKWNLNITPHFCSSCHDY